MMSSKRQSENESERKIWKKLFKVREESVQLAVGSVYAITHFITTNHILLLSYLAADRQTEMAQ